MFSFLFPKNKRIDGFATRMADDFLSAIPLDVTKQCLANNSDKKKTKVLESKMKDIAIQFQQFKKQEKLGVYGIARLHLTFMNRLELLGYDQDRAKQINEMIMLKSI